MPKYYQVETPIGVYSEAEAIEFYPKAKRLVFALPLGSIPKGKSAGGKLWACPLNHSKTSINR